MKILKSNMKLFTATGILNIGILNIQNLITNLNNSANQIQLTKTGKFPDVLHVIRN